MARGATKFRSWDSFGGHRPMSGGSSAFLKGWKDKKGIDTWMHIRQLPIAIWRHQLPAIVVLEDKQTREKVKHVFSKKFTCHETEDVLGAMYFRDRETGERKTPPERCGLCKLLEWEYQQMMLWIDTGGKKGLDPTIPLFHFESESEKSDDETTTLYGGGMTNLFGKDEVDVAVLKRMKEQKIRRDEVWKQNTMPKCEYAFTVVDNDNPQNGVQIAVETRLLGEKVQEVINKTLKSRGRNPQTDPYCIRWEYNDAKGIAFNKMYDALAMERIPLTPRIKRLISGEAPDLSGLTEPFNQQSIRAVLEAHAEPEMKTRIPWDELFPTREQEAKWKEEDEAEEKEEEELEAREATRDVGSSADLDDDGGDADEDELFECDNEDCKKPIRASDAECPHCGHKYEVTGKEPEPEKEEPPPAKPLRSRSEATKAKAAAAPAPTRGRKPAAKGEEAAAEVDEDSIPF